MKKIYKAAIQNYPLLDPLVSVEKIKNVLSHEQNAVNKIPLYIHIPFCDSICEFCVYSRQKTENSEILSKYTDAVIKEIKNYGKYKYINNSTIETIFLGGGTPTVLTEKQLVNIITACKDYLPVAKDIEITVECNIANADYEKIASLQSHQVTRFSLGAQTFQDDVRKKLNLNYRKHDLVNWVEKVNKNGAAVSLDLMYGLPDQDYQKWINDITFAIQLPVKHISIYQLSILSGSILYQKEKRNMISVSNDNSKLFEMYNASHKILEEHGFNRQLICEYHVDDHKSKYWDLVYSGNSDVIAVGASSFGYINGITYQNQKNIQTYEEMLNSGSLPIWSVSEMADKEKRMERYIILGFRKGFIDTKQFEVLFNCKLESKYFEILDDYIKRDMIYSSNGKYVLTPKGIFYQGEVSVSFMKSTFGNSSELKKKLSVSQNIVPERLIYK